jgi:general secretion pathway protein F
MTAFRFAAIDRAGQRKNGRLEAESRESALAELRAAGLRTLSIEQAEAVLPFWQRDILGGDKPTQRDVISFFQDFATLLGANLTVDRALRLSLRQASKRMQPVLQKILAEVVAGRAVSDAMRNQAGIFPDSSIEVVRAGELTGALAEVVARIAETMRRQQEMQSAITSALIYPALLLVMAFGIVLLVVTSLLPSIAPLFNAPGVVAPLPIRLLQGGQAFLEENWQMLTVGSVLCLIALVLWWRNAAMRAWRNRMWRRVPLIGGILNEIDAGRVCRILGTLVAARVPLPQALAVAQNMPNGIRYRQTLGSARQAIQEGARLADALAPLYATSPQMVDMIRTGEEVNRLADMLLRVADLAEDNVRTRIDRLFTLLTPVITIVMGLIIGGLIMSIMSAVLSINDLAAGPV